jgi:hypothetical protein
MALSINLDGSFGDVQHWERIIEEAKEFDSTEACITNDQATLCIPTGCYANASEMKYV